MTIDELELGDVLHIPGIAGSEYIVSGIDTVTHEVTAKRGLQSYTYNVELWSKGCTKKQPLVGYGGIMSFLPGTPSGQWTIAVDPGQEIKPAKTRRQVSHNGKDWVDYRHLLDADDFECYAHRREV